jgi:hypothetical protein
MARQPKILQPAPLKTPGGRHGRRFHAPRAPSGFTSDPPGFQTEKDPRGKGSDSWFDLPPPTGIAPFHLDLAAVLSKDVMDKIISDKRMVFHSVGDTGGVNTTTYQQHVATYMELDFQGNDHANPAFFYHLGDVVYYDGEVSNYHWEFYEPYLHYPAPIFAIPGNHDGDVDPNDQFNKPSDSLKGFVRNFCSQAAVHLPEASDAPRDAMTQPNVYWTLNTPLATIIGLYTNFRLRRAPGQPISEIDHRRGHGGGRPDSRFDSHRTCARLPALYRQHQRQGSDDHHGRRRGL